MEEQYASAWIQLMNTLSACSVSCCFFHTVRRPVYRRWYLAVPPSYTGSEGCWYVRHQWTVADHLKQNYSCIHIDMNTSPSIRLWIIVKKTRVCMYFNWRHGNRGRSDVNFNNTVKLPDLKDSPVWYDFLGSSSYFIFLQLWQQESVRGKFQWLCHRATCYFLICCPL